jgi:N5-(carboxyethyl)ornithine synthase
MKTIGFIKSDKENENRIALFPEDISKIKNKDYVFVEKNYGIKCGIEDNEYEKKGIKVVSREEILEKNIICDPKIGDAMYLKNIKNKVIFGWIHAVQNKDITDTLIENQLTAFAWEDMFENGRHVFWRNNEIAGEAAVMHALLLHGIMPYNSKVAILGNGNASRGAYRVLTQLGAKVCVYTRKMEDLFKEELMNYDIIVNALLWDTKRKDHIIYRHDLKNLKKNALIIDVSCDKNGAIETSIPTTIENPVYNVDGIVHYVVDHTPALVYKTVSLELSKACSKYIDSLIEEKYDDVLKECLCVQNGKIIDKRINEFQNR